MSDRDREPEQTNNQRSWLWIYDEVNREFACDHKALAVRRRVQSNGVEIFVQQCVRCGKSQGAISKHKVYGTLAPSEIHAIKDFEQSIADEWEAKRSAFMDQLRERWLQEEHDEWWETYTEYLNTAKWAEKRALVLRRANGICEGCGVNRPTQVHHTTYDHVRDELLWELKAVCDECHEYLHPGKDLSSEKFITLTARPNAHRG